MPPLPFLPDDVLSTILAFLVPPPPLSMASTPQPLLSDVLDHCRPLDTSRKDIRSFWEVSKRFKALADRDFYSYIQLRDVPSCHLLAQQLDRWNLSGSSEAVFVVGLSLTSLSRTSTSPTYNIHGTHPLHYLIRFFPNLYFIDFGAKTAVTASLLAGLASFRPQLRSIVGLGLSLEDYDSAVTLLSVVSSTLQHLEIVDITSMESVGNRLITPSLELPYLLSLSHSSVTAGGPSDVAVRWKLPRLRKLVEGLDPQAIMGGSVCLPKHLAAHGGSLEETTCPMAWAPRDLDFKEITKGPRITTLAMHLDSSWAEWDDLEPGEDGKGSRVETLVLVQARTRTDDQLHASPDLHHLLSTFVSQTTFPKLKTVYWITARPNDYIWSSWSRIAVDLVASGVKVVYV